MEIMETIFVVGEFTQQIERYVANFFLELGIKTNFLKAKPRQKGIVIFKKNIAIHQTANSSLYGIAFPESNVAFIKYPSARPMKIECKNAEGIIDPLKLFSWVALHEYLHLKGLEHCSSPGCIMAKLECKEKKADGYCISCLSATNTELPLCKKCREKAGDFIRL